MPSTLRAISLLFVYSAACDRSSPIAVPVDVAMQQDLSFAFAEDGMAPPPDEAPPPPGLSWCVRPDVNQNCCVDRFYGSVDQQFPLQSDAKKDPREQDTGIRRNIDGALVLSGVAGTYTIVVDAADQGGDSSRLITDWQWFRCDAIVPPQTTLSVRSRSGKTPVPDQTWTAWTPVQPVGTDPLALPWGRPEDFYLMQLEFTFTSKTPGTTPTLHACDIAYNFECGLG